MELKDFLIGVWHSKFGIGYDIDEFFVFVFREDGVFDFECCDLQSTRRHLLGRIREKHEHNHRYEILHDGIVRITDKSGNFVFDIKITKKDYDEINVFAYKDVVRFATCDVVKADESDIMGYDEEQFGSELRFLLWVLSNKVIDYYKGFWV